MTWGTISSGCDQDVNAMLDILLDRLDGALEEAGIGAADMPIFVVEASLTERLQAALPGVRFTPEDIRVWAAEISS